MNLTKIGMLFSLFLLSGCNMLLRDTGNGNHMTIVVDGQSNGENLGTEPLARSFAAKGCSNVTVQNVAVGGTTLRQHMPIGDPWADNLTPRGHGLWNTNLPKIKAAQPDVYVWWQGEAEASYGPAGLYTYASDFESFIHRLRAQGDTHFTVVVILISKQIWVGVSPAFPTGTPAWREFRRQEESIQLDNCLFINIDDLKSPGGEGAVHFTPAQYEIVADRVASAYMLRNRR